MAKVIFDVDGVLLSEKRYFDVSALVVWEWYFSPLYMGLGQETIQTAVSEDEIAELRARFWKNDEILSWLKGHGVNSNWDMVHAHILVTLWYMLKAYGDKTGSLPEISLQSNADIQQLGQLLSSYPLPTAADILARLDAAVPVDADKDGVFVYLGQAIRQDIGSMADEWTPLGSSLWQREFECFQEWYFGDTLYERTYGKRPYAPGKEGFLQHEEPLGTIDGIRHMFQELKRRGYKIAIATGRSQMEMEVPFKTYGWYNEFDPHYICTDTDVEAAEKQLSMSLGKPNPFVYYVGAFGKNPENYAAYATHPETFKKEDYYVVGDSLADVWCAKAMGATMIGTLTGLEGKAAQSMFEREGAAYVVESVEEILKIL